MTRLTATQAVPRTEPAEAQRATEEEVSAAQAPEVAAGEHLPGRIMESILNHPTLSSLDAWGRRVWWYYACSSIRMGV